ncbi:CHAD domain-containing protein [Rhizobium glycinendophyticum]|uniref:CHAD domain-containing protein n=1 Tax=Rhizobium glycinendophyticum TaxID=2589807 RepID=A0A504UI41_9HYPH|nr:CHAD domain-containing protein [Rhizobium glycinendophyticum]TPP06541.1 CHAD domain-containing protein [Rhizobium glycinendophyticum]
MPYRIRPDRDLPTELRSVARRQLDHAITVLQAKPDGLHEAIHEARKKFKRVRNLLRLVAHADKAFFKQQNTSLGAAARSLSRIRDATALMETVTHLTTFANEEEAETLDATRTVLELRRDEIAAQETDLEEKVAGVIADCRLSLGALEALDLPSKAGPAARLIAKGWLKALKRAHAALDGCKSEGHGESFHDLRKSAQAHWMNLSLLRDLWPSAFAAKSRDAKILVDLLGHEHDLTVLTELFDTEPDLFGSGEDQSFLLAIIIRRQQDLRREALALAEIVFSDGARREADVIETLWTAAAIGKITGHG